MTFHLSCHPFLLVKCSPALSPRDGCEIAIFHSGGVALCNWYNERIFGGEERGGSSFWTRASLVSVSIPQDVFCPVVPAHFRHVPAPGLIAVLKAGAVLKVPVFWSLGKDDDYFPWPDRKQSLEINLLLFASQWASFISLVSVWKCFCRPNRAKTVTKFTKVSLIFFVFICTFHCVLINTNQL